MSPRTIDLFFVETDTPNYELSYQGTLSPGAVTSTNVKVGSKFLYTLSSSAIKALFSKKTEHVDFDSRNHLGEFVINDQDIIYEIYDEPDFPPDPDSIDERDRERAFMLSYATKNNGLQWLHHFGFFGPRPKPSLFMWSAPHVGHSHHVTSNETFWMSTEEHGGDVVTSVAEIQKHRRDARSSIELELRCVSTHPKVFVIENFLSSAEADAIITAARPTLMGSVVGEMSLYYFS